VSSSLESPPQAAVQPSPESIRSRPRLVRPNAGYAAWARHDQSGRPHRPAAFQLAACRRSKQAAPGNLPGLSQRTSSKAHMPVYATYAPAASTARRPSVERLPGKHPHAQIKPSEKIKKTPWFDLILLTPVTLNDPQSSNFPKNYH